MAGILMIMGSAKNPAALRAAMYEEHDLGGSSLFSGDFINFGYWQDFVPGQALTVADRTASQVELYRTVLRRARIGAGDRVVEVGCGRGAGAVLILREFAARSVTGVDISEVQLARARKAHADALGHYGERLSFRQGASDRIPLPDNSFDVCLSVEAAQHFDDLGAFAREAHRVLRPGGTFTVTTFFTCFDDAIEQLRPLLETVESGIDAVTPIGAFENDLRTAGFADIAVEPIGDKVWEGYDAWYDYTEFHDNWGRNWLKAYRAGLLDYYLITAHKPES